ncbi:MAG: phage portal protein [Georgenia sp.]
MSVSKDAAMQQSVVWAATRLRADLVSLMPVDVFRQSGAAGLAVEVAKPQVLVEPSEIADGHPMPFGEWMYSGQMSLDRAGNNFGVIRKTDSFGLPAQIDLVATEDVVVRIKGGRIVEYRIAGEVTDSRYVWHERQFTVAGLPIGLSPITYAAMTLSGGINAQQFAIDWFVNGAVPGAILKNEEKKIDPTEAGIHKRRFKAAVQNGDVFVTGKDWTYDPIAANAAESSFLEQMKYTDQDLCRFMGVPGDMIDVAVDSATINYANVTQRNLQLLTMNLGAPIKRREDSLSRLAHGDRYVKLNRAAVLAMDEKSRAELFKARIAARTLTPDEARALEDLAPLAEADYKQFDRLFGARTPNQAQTDGGMS